MKIFFKLFLFFFIIQCNIGCVNSQSIDSLKVEKNIIDESDPHFGYYLFVKPNTENIKGVLVLFPGFGQQSEDIFLDTELHKFAFENDLLTIGFAGKSRKLADSLIQVKTNAVLEDVIRKFKIDNTKFIFGGFSSGGVIALRYVELCKQFPDQFPVNPKGVFMADSPVDLFFSWNLTQEILDNDFYTKVSKDEAKYVEKVYRHYYQTTPSESPERFIELSPFSIDKKYGEHEKHLKDVAVRAYHDVDIVWRLENRNQSANYENYIATSVLINRLNLMGNEQAEFIQTFQTGYRRNGDRHPHSWSIIDEEECINWILEILK